MMSNSPHRIRRLRCLVTTNSQTEAFTIRQCLHDRWQDTLIPAFESAFDEISHSDSRIIHIPKLEFHLKVTSEQELLEVLPELIQQQLNEQLQAMNWETIPTQTEEFGQHRTVQQTQFDTLLHYLQTGSIPWQIAHLPASEIAVNLQVTCHEQRSQLVNYLSNQPETASFYFRLLQLLSTEEAIEIINALSDIFPLESRTAITEFMRFILTGENHLTRHTQWKLVATILSEGFKRSQQHPQFDFSPPDLSRIVDNVLLESGITHNSLMAILPAVVAVLFPPQSSSERPFTTVANPSTSANLDTNATANEARRLPLNVDAMPAFNQRDEISDQEAILPHPQTSAEEITATEPEFPLFVNYAGLVLLHPFISPFFEATGVKETGSREIADCHIPKAAALLHFLATGQEELYEYELGLIKILLGLEPETQLLVGAGLLQEGDRQEAERVLQAVINYWSVLKSTSVDGLRSSFLQRSGLLRWIDNGWRLQVEHQSFDMLLEYLPWSISIIKLSWMKLPIYTEWLTF